MPTTTFSVVGPSTSPPSPWEGALRGFFSDPPVALGEPRPRVQLGPDAVVGPVVGRLGRVALEVHALDVSRAGADEREAALVVGVDELLGGGRRVDEDPEPGERIGRLVLAADGLGDRRARRAPVAVAPGDHL